MFDFWLYFAYAILIFLGYMWGFKRTKSDLIKSFLMIDTNSNKYYSDYYVNAFLSGYLNKMTKKENKKK